MATDSGTAERTVARQLANGVCRSRIRDMFNVLPPNRAKSIQQFR